jgi:hypothetical protein
MVDGFGSPYEGADQKLIPRGLLAYRMFRFVPRPKFLVDGQPVDREWKDFASGKPPVCAEWDSDPDYRTKAAWKQNLLGLGAPEDRTLYHGRGVWEPSLVAVSYGHVSYAAGVNEAYCASDAFVSKPSHPAPLRRCHCGFWAYYQPYVMDTGNTVAWTLIAAVEVSGDVVLGTKGVRAQKMRILGVMPPSELAQDPVEPIVEAWRAVVKSLGVRQYDSLKELLAAYPPEDVSELLPKLSESDRTPEIIPGCPCASCSSMRVQIASLPSPSSPSSRYIQGTPVTSWTWIRYNFINGGNTQF